MTTKNYGLSVRDKLRNLVTENNNYQQLLIRYMHERLLYRLSRSRFNNNFVLKGGALLFVHERFLARPTIDIDFLGERISRDQDTIKNAFIEILSQPCPEDGVIFDTGEDSIVVEDIILDREYNGVKLKFTGHLDTVVQKLSMDIGFGDIVVPSPEKLDYQPMIEGMPGFAINAYSLETVVAEKFQTMMARSLANSRMKDFYDIYNILRHQMLDPEMLDSAIQEVLRNRDTVYIENHPVLQESFRKDEQRSRMWDAFLKKMKIKDGPSFESVMRVIVFTLGPKWEEYGKSLQQ